MPTSFFNRLIAGADNDLFKSSVLLRYLSIFQNEKVSMVFFGLSLTCLWYKVLFVGIGLEWVHNYKLWVIFLILAFITSNLKRLLSTRTNIYMILFMMLLIVSSLWAVINGLELGMLAMGTMALCIFPISFIVASTYRPKASLINMILLLSLPLLIIGCWHGIFGSATTSLWVSSTESLINTRAYGILENPNALGGLSMIVTIISLFAFMHSKKWYYLVYLGFAISALVLTFSRSSWIGLFAGLLFVVVIRYWRLILLSPILLTVLLIPSIRQRLGATFSQEYLVGASLDGRFWAYGNAIDIFKTSPIVGSGPGTFGVQNSIYYNSPIYLRGAQNGYVASAYSDTQWFQILGQCGVVGIIVVALFFVSYLVGCVNNFKTTKNNLFLGTMAVAVALIVSGLFENVWGFGVVAVLSGAYLGLGNSCDS